MEAILDYFMDVGRSLRRVLKIQTSQPLLTNKLGY